MPIGFKCPGVKLVAKVKLFIADDQFVTRSGLVAMARESPGLTVAGEAVDADSTVTAVREMYPDIILLNLRALTGADLRQLVDRIDRQASIIVLRCSNSCIRVDEAVQAQVAGFADLDALQGDLVSMVSLVKRGCAVCILADGKLSSNLFEYETTREPEGYDDLTLREHEVLRLVSKGLTNKRIATALHVAETTVKKHVSRAMGKIGVTSRVEAAILVSRYEADRGS